MSKVTKIAEHPSAARRFPDAAKRFLTLRDRHQSAANAMWIGMLASEFTDAELEMLPDYLSPGDVRLLGKVRQPLPVKHSAVLTEVSKVA